MTSDTTSAAAADRTGTSSVRSPFTVAETVDRITHLLEAKGIEIFALIDHSGGAQRAGLQMNDTKLIVFGNPRAGTPAMVAAPLLAIELPLKALVWADDADAVWVTYRDAADLRQRFDLPAALVEPLSHVGDLVAGALGL